MLNFEPHAAFFSGTNALYLATASAIAYADAKTAQARVVNELGLGDFHFFDIRNAILDTQAFGALSDTHAVLAFRGTEQKRFGDWASDLSASPTPFRWLFSKASDVGLVHAGFGHTLHDSWSPIIAWLKAALTDKPRTLWMTGHSLGGALAVMAAATCSFDPDSLLPLSGVYTFGQPRVGLHGFCQLLHAQIGRRFFRFANRQDLVPRVPFRGWDYGDAGHFIHIGSDGIPRADSVEWRSFVARKLESFEQFFGIVSHLKDGLVDHGIEAGYIASIRRQLDYLNSAAFNKTLL
ncbi:MAG: lipase class 3 [Chthoniobacteraceae bacterium]|nr:lipase class 3 [Chthoniobacteraceae bacterium]